MPCCCVSGSRFLNHVSPSHVSQTCGLSILVMFGIRWFSDCSMRRRLMQNRKVDVVNTQSQATLYEGVILAN